MDDSTIQDLKQFVSATASQEGQLIRTELAKEFNDLDEKLSKKIDDRTDEVLAVVGENTETRFGLIESDMVDLQTRVTRLEPAA